MSEVEQLNIKIKERGEKKECEYLSVDICVCLCVRAGCSAIDPTRLTASSITEAAPSVFDRIVIIAVVINQHTTHNTRTLPLLLPSPSPSPPPVLYIFLFMAIRLGLIPVHSNPPLTSHLHILFLSWSVTSESGRLLVSNRNCASVASHLVPPIPLSIRPVLSSVIIVWL